MHRESSTHRAHEVLAAHAAVGLEVDAVPPAEGLQLPVLGQQVCLAGEEKDSRQRGRLDQAIEAEHRGHEACGDETPGLRAGTKGTAGRAGMPTVQRLNAMLGKLSAGCLLC